MPTLRVILLWHQHQPFYKDLVSGEYRMPWVRLHALKDYYGMVKLLDEFPSVHQNFNIVPSLMVQIQDYVAGTAQDPFLAIAAKPSKDLSPEERRFALQYLFQANPANLIGRYPRYRELWDRFQQNGGSAERAERYFQAQDFTDLQVLSQIAWFDEFFLEEKDIAELVAKGRNYSLDDQRFVVEREKTLLAKVLPAVLACAAPEFDCLALVKPQFEVGKGAVGKGGVVRDPDQHREVVRGLRQFASEIGYAVAGEIPSPIVGAKGNREFLLYLKRHG